MRDRTGSSNQALPVSAAVEDIIVTKYFSAKDGRFLPWRLSIAHCLSELSTHNRFHPVIESGIPGTCFTGLTWIQGSLTWTWLTPYVVSVLSRVDSGIMYTIFVML